MSKKTSIKLYFVILILILFSGVFFIVNSSYAGCQGCSGFIRNCPSSSVTGPYTFEFRVGGGKCTDICPKGDPCVSDCEGCSVGRPQYNLDGGTWTDVPDSDIQWVQDETSCDCQCQPGGCSDCQQEIVIAEATVSQLGTHTIEFRSTSACLPGWCTDSCTFTITPVCECDFVGWGDPPTFWGGCSDCNQNSTNNCEPCGEAQAYCDGCNWDNRWNPFRDEYYSGTGPGHKCPGSPCPINNPPNIPTLIAPPHNTWINYNPTFQAQVSDPDNDNVRAYFNVLDYGDGWGNWVNSNQISSWGPRNIGTCSQNWWRARAQDAGSLWSDWSGYWLAKVDKDSPSVGISYPTGTINYSTFTVQLSESDTCSGITEGDVDIRIKPPGSGWSNWQDYASTINDFNYTGQDGYEYQFRYRTKDNANNWSNFTEGGTVTIKLNKPPTATNLLLARSDPCRLPLFYGFNWTYSDPDNDNESRFDFQVDDNSNFSSPEVNRFYTNLSNPSPSQNVQAVIVYFNPASDSLLYNTTYYWRVMVYDNQGADSGWTNGSSFATPPAPYPIPDFTWLPNRPATGEDVQFTDKTTVFGGATIIIWSWTFQDANPAISNQQNPKIIFVSPGQKSVNLRVTDSNNNTCDVTKTVRVNYPLPRWREVKP